MGIAQPVQKLTETEYLSIERIAKFNRLNTLPTVGNLELSVVAVLLIFFVSL
jgi:hypothetical protein